jgi:hypothetical protein
MTRRRNASALTLVARRGASLRDQHRSDRVRGRRRDDTPCCEMGNRRQPTGLAPSRKDDEAFNSWFARRERLGASPAAVIELMKMNSEIDIRGVLPAIRVPTLVMKLGSGTRTFSTRCVTPSWRRTGSKTSGDRRFVAIGVRSAAGAAAPRTRPFRTIQSTPRTCGCFQGILSLR